jgi:hypothetical protein
MCGFASPLSVLHTFSHRAHTCLPVDFLASVLLASADKHPPLLSEMQVHAYERWNPQLRYKYDPCGPIYITIGDGGNVEGVSRLPSALTALLQELAVACRGCRLIVRPPPCCCADLQGLRGLSAAAGSLQQDAPAGGQQRQGAHVRQRAGLHPWEPAAVLPHYAATHLCLQVRAEQGLHLCLGWNPPTVTYSPRRTSGACCMVLDGGAARHAWPRREPSFGHGVLEIKSPYEADWTWCAAHTDPLIAHPLCRDEQMLNAVLGLAQVPQPGQLAGDQGCCDSVPQRLLSWPEQQV